MNFDLLGDSNDSMKVFLYYGETGVTRQLNPVLKTP